MPELTPFDARLEAAIHGFADRAQTSVDAAATAERAMRQRHRGRLAWLGAVVPVPALDPPRPGAPRAGPGGLARDRCSKAWPGRRPADRRRLARRGFASGPRRPIPPPTAWATRSSPAPAILALTIPYAESRTGATTRLRDGVITVTARMSDPRASGTGPARQRRPAPDHRPPMGGVPAGERGQAPGRHLLRRGMGRGAVGGAWSCRLTGSGAYDNYSYLFSATTSDPGIDDVRGVIVPDPLPSP